MKLVTFARAMAPHAAGETRLVSDDVAARLSKTGDITASEPWPTPAPAAQKPSRKVAPPARPVGEFDLRMAK